jgi:hypothetical protein
VEKEIKKISSNSLKKTHCTTSKKEASSLTKQKQEKISKMFGVNDNTLIFAPAFEKSTEIIDSD